MTIYRKGTAFFDPGSTSNTTAPLILFGDSAPRGRSRSGQRPADWVTVPLWRTWSRQQRHSAHSHLVKVRFGLTTSDPYRPNYSPSIAILGSDDVADRGSEAIRQPQEVEAPNDDT